jgi:hypothetical protein
VVLAGEDEGLHHAVAVDRRRGLVGVLLDDREEVGQQLALERGEVRGRIGGRGGRCAAAVVDGQAAGGGPGGVRRTRGDGLLGQGRRRGGRLGAGAGAAVQAARFASALVSVVRYRSPSSSSAW